MEYINTMLSICGGISIIGGAMAVVWKWVRPAVKLNDRVQKLEEKADLDHEDIQEIKKITSAMGLAMVKTMEHQIYGNHKEDLIKAKDDLMKLITES